MLNELGDLYLITITFNKPSNKNVIVNDTVVKMTTLKLTFNVGSESGCVSNSVFVTKIIGITPFCHA
jgi:hypothetical protein